MGAPRYASYLLRIASFSRLIMFDKRGFGLSDPIPADQLPNLETRMDDLRAVMDAVGSDRAVIYGASRVRDAGSLVRGDPPRTNVGAGDPRLVPVGEMGAGRSVGLREDEFADRLGAIERVLGHRGVSSSRHSPR